MSPGITIRVTDSEFKVRQVIGGTRATDYVYVLYDDYFINVKYLRGCRLIRREKRRRGLLEEVYRVPKSMLVM